MHCLPIVLALAAAARPTWRASNEVALVNCGQPAAVICVPAGLMEPDRVPKPPVKLSWTEREQETQRRRLRESVNDLALYIEKMSGARLDIIQGLPPWGDRRLPILIGDLAVGRFGPVSQKAPGKQAFRVVVAAAGVGLAGESDLAVSYAIYDVLDNLGCRWYMPSDLGEEIPRSPTIRLPLADYQSAPGTIVRRIWYADEGYLRRNRCGGVLLNTVHCLEGYITEEQRKQHPEWRATIGGQPSPWRLRWSNPAVADAIADAIIERLDKDYQPSMSLSPGDGDSFDESPEDRALDAGDFDPIHNGPSITDRYVVLCNRIAKRVTAKYPEVLFGALAYVRYTRPPVREKPHPNVVPHIAAISYVRSHPMTDDAVPNNRDLRALIEGWGKAAGPNGVSMYFYGYNLAEPLAPNPMIAKWSANIPFVYQNRCKWWKPETMATFDASLHALYLSLRMAWDPTRKPADVLEELNRRFYGNAAEKMAAYWRYIDDAWVNTPEYSGCGFAYLRRWTPEVMKTARQRMDEALAACRTITEYRRVKLADESLQLFEVFMKLRSDLAEGRFANLPNGITRWRGYLAHLGQFYREQYAFGGPPSLTGDSLMFRYFSIFYERQYRDAGRIGNTKEFQLLTPKPIRQWRYKTDPDQKGEELGWQRPDCDDKDWGTTDSCVESWSSLGLHNYFGRMWYRAAVTLPKTFKMPEGKKVFLWVGSVENGLKVFVNGQHVPWVNPQGEKVDEFSGYCQPVSFDVTRCIKPQGANQITLMCTRAYLRELGIGGLLGPAALYMEK